MSDLFDLGAKAALDRFTAKTVVPKKTRPARLPLTSEPIWTEAQIARIRRQRAEDYYRWALDELPRWKDRLPDSEYRRLAAHVASLQPKGE